MVAVYCILGVFVEVVVIGRDKEGTKDTRSVLVKTGKKSESVL